MTIVADPQYSIPATDDDRRWWIELGEFCRDEPEFLTFLKAEYPEDYAALEVELAGLAIEARSADWRTPGLGGRPEQLIPGTAGSFSERTDWVTWLLVGGRGSGKSRTGAEAVREMLTGREWGHDRTTPPYFALVGKRLDDVRVNMVQNTLLPILPPGSVRQWNRSTVELTLTNGVYIRGFSSAEPENLRGPNLIGAWGDEVATWEDANRSPRAVSTTLSNLKGAVRNSDGGTWVPRIILTTTPKPVRILRNPDPDDENDPGPGLYDDPTTVVSNMSTMANEAHLSPHFIESVVKPLIGTRLYRQEILGELIDAAKGALWSAELIERTTVPASHVGVHTQVVRTVVAVDPSVGAGQGAECGIVVAALCTDGRAYVLEDCSMRGTATEWSAAVRSAVYRWDADEIVAEVNQGGELVANVIRRDRSTLRIREVRARKGKRLRAEPAALLSDQDRLRIACECPRLVYQMMTWDPEEDDESPDRVDALVYAAIALIPPENVSELITTNRGRLRR